MSVAAARAERVRWADTAKGVCILLVVLWHVVAKHYLRLDWPEGLRIPGAWGTFGELLLPLRMPLFFTISGMFALGAVHRPWRVSARSRVAKFGYLYVLWLLLHTGLLSLAPDLPTDRATSPLDLLEQLTITPSNLWYLYALALYFVIAKATWRLPRYAVLGGALVLSIAASAELLPVPGNRASLLQNLVFFLAGLYFRPYVERLATGAGLVRLALATGAYGAALLAMVATGSQDVPGVWPLVCVTAAVFGTAGAAVLDRWELVAAPLASIGRRTLPIYVMHMPLLALLDLLLAEPLSVVPPPLETVLAVVEPVLLTALLTWVCLALHRGMEATGLSRSLLDLPGDGKGTAGARTAPASAAPPVAALAPTGPAEPHAAPAPPTPTGSGWEGPVHPGPAHAGAPLSDEPGHSQPAHPGPTLSEPVHPGPIHPDPAHRWPIPTEPGQHQRADPGHPEPGHPKPIYAKPTNSEPAHPGPALSRPVHPGPAHSGSTPAQPEPVHLEPIHPGTAHTLPARNAAVGAPGTDPSPGHATADTAPITPPGRLASPVSARYPDPAVPGPHQRQAPAVAHGHRQVPATDQILYQIDHPTVPLSGVPRRSADAEPYPPPQAPAHRPARVAADGHHEPSPPASRPAWFELPQNARGSSWTPGTAGAGEEQDAPPAFHPEHFPPATEWSWFHGSRETRPVRREPPPREPGA